MECFEKEGEQGAKMAGNENGEKKYINKQKKDKLMSKWLFF